MQEVTRYYMMYYRRKIILNLLDHFDGNMTAKRFQKLLFLLTRSQEKKSFDFVPYKYGSYSFQAGQDLHTMAGQNFLQIIDKPGGSEILLKSMPGEASGLTLMDSAIIETLRAKYGSLSQDELIKYTYIKYPFYAIRSVMAKHLLSQEELSIVHAQDRHYDEPALFTLGYEGLSLEKYINKLLINDVRVLCDVRKNAYSQKYGFTKGTLKMACEGVGIKYVHVPQLGIESEERQDLKTQADYDRLFERYEATTLKRNWESLLQVREIIRANGRVVLTCFEADPKQCHRSRVAKALMTLQDRDYQLTHLRDGIN